MAVAPLVAVQEKEQRQYILINIKILTNRKHETKILTQKLYRAKWIMT